ncbi:MAG: hypothetical protein GY859_04270 [Desulfobacterales bacterium]|nr:hypothetical protein [Desulfobacterales bacterium]
MPLDEQHPVFRKEIAPWYDSEAACFAAIFFLILVLLYGVAGVSAALESAAHHAHIWIPILLIVFSAAVIASIIIRLVKRYMARASRLSTR